MKLNFKNKRFLQYQLEFYQHKKLSLSSRELYSFIYNHCVFHSDDLNQGWCGMSNEKLAEKLEVSAVTIKKLLAELKEKEMIIIENAGKRTKKTGESRQIHINAKNYIIEEIQSLEDSSINSKELERLKLELEELRKENNQLNLKLAQTTHITEIGRSLIRTGFISESRYQEQAEELNHILLDFESWHKEGRDLTMACFNYWNTHKDSYIKNPVKYILACIDASKNWINRKDRTAEDYQKELLEALDKWETENHER